MSVDPAAVEAIDVHTHVQASVHDTGGDDGGGFAAMAGYFKAGPVTRYTVPMLAGHYRERRMAAVVFTVDTAHLSGREQRPSNEEIAEQAALHSDVLIPFASVDPHRGAAGVKAARRLIEHHGVRGFKFHPTTQGFFPDDRMAYPLYEVIAEHGLTALFHTGQTGAGAGTPGGGGLRLKYSNPLHVDDVAADFPDLKIILAHPSFPWQDEALAIATHKPNVHIDLSGWSPKYFPSQLVHYANTLLKDKVLFGSDFPMITPERWLADFAKLEIRDEVRPKILKDNAARLFGLTGRP
ncbi:amidohydrolase family protein [Herbidospora yilanensis]|uniref:amidohydrolase family protein n=1 Tax=Herbidospora yilanensis TaxID=354426 RepID=UPI00078084F9|nr:amidohydrolase family protein [Herbidospora yilanensis]